MVCPNCNSENPEGRNFCGHCGGSLSAIDDGQTVALDGGAAAAAARARIPKVAAGLITPPPEATQGATWADAGDGDGAGAPVFSPGTVVASRYRIESLLGEGGMGAVYRAFDMELDRTVALKLVRPEFANSRQTMQRFKQELLLASKISHRNILRIHDLGDANGVKFISMAFIDGADLAGLMEHGALEFSRALDFLRQLCGALEAAHREGVVHRDLKPQNVLIDASDNVYVSDFGLAKSLEPATTMMTRTGQILGTPRYMSPEQVEAAEVDHRSDIYSLGLIAYEMFTGTLPFRGESAMQLMYQRVTERPKDPRAVRPDLPDYIANVILKCLEKDPTTRYRSAREILNDLDAQQAPARTAAAAANETISIVLPKPKASWWMMAAAAVVVAVVALLAIPSTRRLLVSGSAARPHQRIAVLPLRIVGADDAKYLADGVTEALSAKLSGLKGIETASANAVAEAAKRPDIQNDPARLADALRAQLLVRGTLTTSGNIVAVAVTVDDRQRGRTVLNREYKDDRRNLIRLEENVFSGVVNALLIQETNDERARTARRPTGSFDAYDLYLKGRSMLSGQQDVEHLKSAYDLFERAINQDMTFALAFAGAADASILLWSRTKDASWSEKAVSAAEQAQRLDDSLPEAHFSLGTAYKATGKTELAIAELKRSLELAPNSDEAWRRLGNTYQQAGRKAEAIAAYTRATEENPYLWRNWNDFGAAYLQLAGDNEKARDAFARATALAPDVAGPWSNLGVTQYNLGNWKDAAAAFQHALQLQPTNAKALSNLGVATFFLGRYADSVPLFRKAADLNPNEFIYPAYLADALRWSGDRAAAAKAYERAITLAFKSLEVNPSDTEALGIVAICYAKKGDDTRAVKYIRQALQIKPDAEDNLYREASIHALAQRKNEALASLESALRRGHSAQEAQSDPELKWLSADPEFASMLKRVATPAAK